MFKILFFLDLQANLPETSTFFSAQMAVLSSYLQMFIVHGMYNFVSNTKCCTLYMYFVWVNFFRYSRVVVVWRIFFREIYNTLI